MLFTPQAFHTLWTAVHRAMRLGCNLKKGRYFNRKSGAFVT